MAYPKGKIPSNVSENTAALEAATQYADYLSSLGARVQWVRGMQTYSARDDWYMARADVAVASPDGEIHQFGADCICPTGDFKRVFWANAEDFGRLYRIALWASAAKAAITPLLLKAFPKYHVTLGQELSVLAVYRNGLLMHSRYAPRRLKGFIEGFRAAYELTAPHPDTAQTNPEGSAPTDPPLVQPE